MLRMVPVLPVVLGLGVLGGGGVLLSKVFGGGRRTLEPLAWVRVTLDLEQARDGTNDAGLQHAIEEGLRAETLEPRLVLADSTNAHRWTSIAQFVGGQKTKLASSPHSMRGMTFTKVEPVDAPPLTPRVDTAYHPAGRASPVISPPLGHLDAHLPPETERAVIIATSKETSPTPLVAFAEALTHDFPAAASALVARASQLASPPTTSGIDLNPIHAIQSFTRDIVGDIVKAGAAAAFIPGIGAISPFVVAMAGAKAGHTKFVQGLPVIRDIKRETDRLASSKVFQGARDIFVQLHPAIFLSLLASTASNSALSGDRLDRVLDEVRKKGGAWLKTEGALASVIPGVGTVLSPVLTAAGALALGEPIPEALIEVAAGAVPGGAVAQTAVRSGASFAVNLSKGQKLDQAAIGAARSILPAQARPAFDVGLALAQGKNLQKAGFQAAVGLLGSVTGSVAEKAFNAINLGSGDLAQAATKMLQKELPKGAADLARVAANHVLQTPKLATMPSHAVARHLNMPEPVVRSVLASTSTAPRSATGTTTPLVHARALKAIVGHPSKPTGAVDSVHVKLALKEANGDSSATRQLSYLAAQEPAKARAIDEARRMALRALWTRHYLAMEGRGA